MDNILENELDVLRKETDLADNANNDTKEDDAVLSSFRNDNWPRLPLRDVTFEQWIKSNANSNEMSQCPESMWFPVPSQKPEYKLYTDQEMLDMAVIWLDVDTAIRLMEYPHFDLNRQNKEDRQRAYVHQLSGSVLPSGYRYGNNVHKFSKLMTAFCRKNVDLEAKDEDKMTALAHAIRGGSEEICIILLKYGANLGDESVQKELQMVTREQRRRVREEIARWRHYLVLALREVMEMMLGVGDNTVYKHILDFMLVSDESISL